MKVNKYYKKITNQGVTVIVKRRRNKKKFNNKKQLRVRIKGNKGIKNYKKYKFIKK